ncbi:MAG: hypothetical protein ABFS35_05770 [Bacteroidota bacterium]
MISSPKLYLPIVLLFLFLFSQKLVSQEKNTFLIKPSGNYSIGTTELFLTDSSRKEKLKTFNKSYRRLYVKVWYPSTESQERNCSKYLSSYSSKIIYQIFKSKNISIKDIDELKNNYTYSCPNLDISKDEKKFPVLLFNPGFYFGMADIYTCYMEELASNGYIVFSIIHPYQQPLVIFSDGKKAKLKKKKAQLAFLEWTLKQKIKFEDITSKDMAEKHTRTNLKQLKRFNKVVDLWVVDSKFVIDYLYSANLDTSSFFYSKLNIDKIGILGQSLGGAVAGQVCFNDNRIKAGINLDNFQFGDIVDNDMKTPFMLIESEYKKTWNIGNEYIFSHVKSDFYSLLLLNTTHFITSDAPLMPILTKEQQQSFFGAVDGRKIVSLINKYILDFFNFYLKNISSNLLTKEVSNSDIIYKVRN